MHICHTKQQLVFFFCLFCLDCFCCCCCWGGEAGLFVLFFCFCAGVVVRAVVWFDFGEEWGGREVLAQCSTQNCHFLLQMTKKKIEKKIIKKRNKNDIMMQDKT